MNASEQLMTCRKAKQPTSKPDSVIDHPGQTQAEPVYGLSGVRRRGCMSLVQALMWNVGTCWLNVKGRGVATVSGFASSHVSQRGGATRSSDEGAVMGERRGCVIQPTANGRSNKSGGGLPSVGWNSARRKPRLCTEGL